MVLATVNQIEYFKTGPDIIKTEEGAMTAAFAAITVKQQSTEANVNSYIRRVSPAPLRYFTLLGIL